LNLKDYLQNSNAAINSALDCEKAIEAAVNTCVQALGSGNKIIFCGNGGSAADAQHLAAEFMGRFLIDRAPLPALSLTVDTSALTAIANDYGYSNIFERQLQGVGNAGDVLFGLSTSGASENVIKAFRYARGAGINTISLTGSQKVDLHALSDIVIQVNSEQTNFIQEAHIVIGHFVCMQVENRL
jgi:D-sedoheptulose 7-phosphate isomerase